MIIISGFQFIFAVLPLYLFYFFFVSRVLIFAFTMNVAQVQEMINASLQQQQAKAKEEVDRLKEQLKVSNRFARDLKIEQAKKNLNTLVKRGL